MKNDKVLKAIIGVAAGVILFVAGYAVGLLQNQGLVSPGSGQGLTNLVKTLNTTPVISDIVATGNITNISGRKITVKEGEKSLTIPIRKDAEIYSFVSQGATSQGSTPSKISFSELKVGDYINIYLNVLTNGEIEGARVILVPLSF